MILASLAALGAVVVAFVLLPVFTDSGSERAVEATDDERELRDLEEKKTQLYDNIADLDFERASGKVSEADYERARGDYLAQVAKVIARIDELAPAKKPAKKPPRKTSKKATAAAEASRKCGSCGAASPETANFCVECGKPLGSGCASCGEELPEGARFCPACGKKTA